MRERVLIGVGAFLLVCLAMPAAASARASSPPTHASAHRSATLNALGLLPYTCTAVSSTNPSGPTTLTSTGSAACSLPVSQHATVSISPVVLGIAGGAISSQTQSCANCAAIVVNDTATVVPAPGVTYQGLFVDDITSLAGTTIIPGGGCTRGATSNTAVCTAKSTYTF